MTNEVPDFEKIADETILNFVPMLGHKEPVIFEEDFDKLKTEIVCAMQSAYLAGRKAQVKVDFGIVNKFICTRHEVLKNGSTYVYECDCGNPSSEIAKAIESQVIE